MLNYEFPPIGGGGGAANRALLQQYAGSSQLNVELLTSAERPGTFKEKFAENITIHKIGIHKKHLHHWRKIEVLEWLAKAQRYYQRMILANSYDLAHAFFGFPTGWLCYRNAGKLPFIISLRGSDVPGQHARLKLDYKILGPTFKRIWNSSMGLIACSEGLKRRALDFLPSAKIEVIPNGVELNRFRPVEKQADKQTLKILTVGRLSVTKRVHMLIEAVEILVKQDQNIHLTIVGDGALGQELKGLISKKGLDKTIEMTGRIDSKQMPEIYQGSDIFVSASLQEGMSNAMLEAMASGLPIITTRCEGVEELIKDNGIVVETDDAEAIAASVKKLASDNMLFDSMCVAARLQAERFSWERIAEDYIQYYETTLQKGE